jgi:hypothetical protein
MTDKIHGLEIKPSQQAQDLLAAFHLGAQTVLATLAPQGMSSREVSQQIVMAPEAEQNDGPDISLADIWGMDPLQREALLSSYGLTVSPPPGQDPDPTAHNVNAILEAGGVATKPESGGETLRHYEPTDEGEVD